jgi:nucleoside-diphosphate-sugar epimerase
MSNSSLPTNPAPPRSVLVIGATGYVGSVVASAFADAGYEVHALRRPGGTPPPSSYRPVSGDLTDPATLREAARGFDLVLHIGATLGAKLDLAGADALVAAGSPVIYTSGADVLPGGHTTEDTPTDPHPLVQGRDGVERRYLAAGGWVIRLGMVYGPGGGQGGVVEKMLAPLAARVGAGVYIGDPGTRWGVVHMNDLVALYLAIAERAPAGTVWHAISETVTLDAMAAAVGGGRAISWPVSAEPPPEISFLAGILTYDQDVSSEKTQRVLGWTPRHTSVLADLART